MTTNPALKSFSLEVSLHSHVRALVRVYAMSFVKHQGHFLIGVNIMHVVVKLVVNTHMLDRPCDDDVEAS